MFRKAKQYDERKREFLDVATGLFVKKGYERTTVQEIIDIVGVSKGAFYHYFSSKEDLMDALFEDMVTAHLVDDEKEIIDNPGVSADKKMADFLAMVWRWKSRNIDMNLIFLPILYNEANVHLRNRLLATNRELFLPMLSKLVKQGNDEGVFDVENPVEAVDIIFRLILAGSDAFYEIATKEEKPSEKARMLTRWFGVMLDTIEKILGADKGSLGQIPDSFVRMISKVDLKSILNDKTESSENAKAS
ncbi:MAG: TetR/AcrR family transcriptional regulator [Actinobacteria bacterium]|nr:TetR/AcrR family transcriptional regulator [Actinomycetota bacterium]